MKILVVIVIRIVLVLGLLAAGFALGFPVGQHRGFDTGSEWAIVQADIAAREAGSPVNVSFEEGQIHVIVTQPKGLYKRAQQQAALQYDQTMAIQTSRVNIPVDLEAQD